MQMVCRNLEASLVQRRRQDCKYLTLVPRCAFLLHETTNSKMDSAHGSTFSTTRIGLSHLDQLANVFCYREDGSIDHSSTVPRGTTTAAHKLGPKANQGAINAGLRALDRTGKPCRKWQKGSFKLKSFTGVVWEIPRWKAPPKITVEGTSEGSASGESSKENKDNSQLESEKSEKSNNGADVEMTSNLVSSPAPSLPTPATPAAPIVTASA